MSIFQTKEYLDLFTRHFIPDASQLVDNIFELLADKRAVLIGMKPVLNGQEITDFGDIPNPSKETVQTYLNNLRTTHGIISVQFDYVSEDSLVFKILSELSPVPPIFQEVSPFIDLPTTWEKYLESLERTDRKELKRKWKRLDTIPHTFRFIDISNTPAFEAFIRLHTLSDVLKNQFMTEKMKSFFYDLYNTKIPSWRVKLAFLDIEQNPAASIFYFENNEELLLYNSGYNPEYKYYSAGLLLCTNLIKQGIESGKKKFDFLRGNERYKYDLGGKDCKLYQFTFQLH